MKLAIASDHGGFSLKQAILEQLKETHPEITLIDKGVKSEESSADYPDYAKEVAKDVASGTADCGILVCGTGIGMSIAANKVKGIRAAVVGDVFSARATKEHNNANIICLGQRVLGEGLAYLIVEEWLSAEFEGERHEKRLDKIKQLEVEQC